MERTGYRKHWRTSVCLRREQAVALQRFRSYNTAEHTGVDYFLHCEPGLLSL